ncbi:proline-rich receptor-like protein kinase PERK15 [Iris pallida]|uniref:Proline-rich receptor-like protein kinase PERK15 n=1 Tax=Iris pallida TaxID=29817 RepID=A0AAX6DIJ9_IRIPA|nr:proline-rich receptor-like protein kinase PERK15 [Iris pallida]
MRVSWGSILVRDRGGLLKSPPRLLLLNYLVILSFLELITNALPASHYLEKVVLAPTTAPVGGRILVDPHQASTITELSLPVSLPLIRRDLQMQSSLQSAPSPPPDYNSLTTVGQPSPNSSRLSQPSAKQNQDSAPQASHMPPPIGDTSPSDSNVSSAPYGLVQPPLSPHRSGCCEPNMVPKRGSQICHCIYPVKVELFLQNVSLSSNWSNEFLEELSSQLNLHVAQFEIYNFYVVGVSGLNISMDIAPYTGISFSTDQVNAMNYSLSSHKVHINPMLVGDYRLLNFTWFKPLAPSPAPTLAVSPKPSHPSKSYPHTSQSNGNNDKSSSLTIVVGICAGILIIIIITSVIIICSWKSGKRKKIPVKVSEKLKTADGASGDSFLPHPSSTRFLSYEELKVATKNFEPTSVLGEGGFGRVYRGILSDGMPVAIKKLTTGGNQGDKEFLVEVEMLSRLHHRNLVRLVGYYSSHDSSQNLLCYELVPNGSLESWLHGPLGANCPLDWDTRMKIALDAARGLAYLHEDSQPCVIHRDFKASNILLENNFHAKVSDFGLAKQAPEGRANYLSTRVMGTFGYVAPEYAMTGHLLVKSDVYSYGVVLLELLTGRRPVDMSQPSGQENLVTWARSILRDKDRLGELADPRLARKYPEEDFIRVCTIAAACVAPEASQRPTMGEVVQSLKMVQRLTAFQDTMPVPSARPNIRQSSTTYESDGTSSMFSSGPFSGLSLFDNDNISKTAISSEDLHEGR